MISFDDYEKFFPGCITKGTFDSLMPSASAFVDAVTANRARNAVGYKAERVALAICAVINEMAAQNAARSESGARIASVSNDGYTETYGSLAGASNEETALRSAAFRYLSGTGLVSAL